MPKEGKEGQWGRNTLNALETEDVKSKSLKCLRARGSHDLISA